jgi:hypothetical protein
VSIDTACSSSLVGAHLACTSFLPGGCSRSLATGVNLTIRAETTAVLSKAGMLTVDGRCKTLDASADGYMRGEACVVHLLEAAPADGGGASFPAAAAVILGTAVNQDGRSSSLTAPNGPSQQAVVRAALAWNGMAAGDVGVLEMHGTGTALGDPIEVGAAFAVFQVSSADGDPLKGSCADAWQHLSVCSIKMLEVVSVLPLPQLQAYLPFPPPARLPACLPACPPACLPVQGEGQHPLELQAAKSRTLHTEPAAGAVGLANLALRLGQKGRCVAAATRPSALLATVMGRCIESLCCVASPAALTI